MNFKHFVALTLMLALVAQINARSYDLTETCNACAAGTICPAGTAGNNCIFWNGGPFSNEFMGCTTNACTGPVVVEVSECDQCASPSCCMGTMGINICVPTGEAADRICQFPMAVWLIVLIVVLSLAVVGVIGFVVYKKVIVPRRNQGYVRQGSEPALS